jgi:hypothetical protein
LLSVPGGRLVLVAGLFALLFSRHPDVLLAAALAYPQVSASEPQWSVMTQSGWADRYYIFRMLGWTAAMFTLAGSSYTTTKYLAAGCWQ